MNTYLISNLTRPEAGQVSIRANSVREAVINLIRLTGDNRGICEETEIDYFKHYVMIQNGWTLIVELVDEGQ